MYRVGGLAPRYIVGELPAGALPHIGTTDVDLVIGLALGDDAPETYRTLETNVKRAGLQSQTSFRWTRLVDGITVQVEFLCETREVEPGRIFKPRGEALGSGLGAFNVPGVQLATADFTEHSVEAERLDDGGLSTVMVRVCGLLTYVVLKILAFQDRHENKEAYDLVFCILNFGEGPRPPGQEAARSPVAGHAQVREAPQRGFAPARLRSGPRVPARPPRDAAHAGQLPRPLETGRIHGGRDLHLRHWRHGIRYLGGQKSDQRFAFQEWRVRDRLGVVPAASGASPSAQAGVGTVARHGVTDGRAVSLQATSDTKDLPDARPSSEHR